MNKSHTDITLVIDRSGSMHSICEPTITGINRFLDEQKKCPGTASLTLHKFDHEYETSHRGVPIGEVIPLNTATYVPRGNTALLDAIGRSIRDTGSRLESQPESGRAGRVVFVIVTDGFENASKEFTQLQINEMVTHQRTKYGWEFVYLGANQDAIKVGMAMGVQSANNLTYAANEEGAIGAFAATSSNLRSYRCGTTCDMAYTTEDREEQDKAGV